MIHSDFPDRVFISLSIFLVLRGVDGEVVVSKFISDGRVLCDVSGRLDRGCSKVVPSAKSRVHCMALCGFESSCIGVSTDAQGTCYNHKECPYISTCETENTQHIYIARYCVHGTWDPMTGACLCQKGAFGDRCNKFHTSCRDLIDSGYAQGIYTIYLDPNPEPYQSTPFLVDCVVRPAESKSTVRVLRSQGIHDFNRTWNDFVNGFYYDSENFWVGLYPLYRMTKAGPKTMALFFRDVMIPGNSVYRKYSQFRVLNEAENKYSFTFESTTNFTKGNLVGTGSYYGDCLGSLMNVPFSTWDADNDPYTEENCASSFGSGWWWGANSCGENPCNLLGYGTDYLGIKPRRHVISLLGFDMALVINKTFLLTMNLEEP